MFIMGKSGKMERNLPQNIVALEKSCTFAPLQTKEASVRDVSRGQKRKGAHSSAGLEHLSYKQRVIGSNPIGPTFIRIIFLNRTERASSVRVRLFFFVCRYVVASCAAIT